jgi:ATP-dependent RNA helicase DeaD
MRFADLSLHPSLMAALDRRGYQEPTPVQELMMAPAHRGRDLLVSAQTGSGKTVAFGLAFSAELLGERERFERRAVPLALVIAPTRELALQVQRELEWLYAPAGARVVACVGGMDVRREQRTLAEGAHIVVGTPGRLCDHLDHSALALSHLRTLVLDEADEMLDMGFRDELEHILQGAPTERRTLLLSATLPRGIAQLAKRYQREAVRLVATPPEQAHQDIEYVAHLIAARERDHALVNTLRMHDVPGALVFCATRDGVTHLQASLAERGFEAVAISGELTQSERIRALKALRDGRARVLVATDVAARGLDLPSLDLVVHADLPRDGKLLQHRSGRTGRAGRKGKSVLLVPLRWKREAERMLKEAGTTPRWAPVPSVEEIRARDAARLVEELAASVEETSDESLATAGRLLASNNPERLVAALLRRCHATLPAPEELPETAALHSRPRGRRDERPAPEHRHSGRHQPPGDGVWFRVNVGRRANADPRWLLPLLCRRGGITKSDIGTIDIMANETRVFVHARAAQGFEREARRPDTKDPLVRIEPLRPSRPFRR